MANRAGVRIGKAGKLGRGVYATRDYGQDELIERAPLLVISSSLDAHIISNYTKVGSYVFEYGKQSVCLGMGFVSFCNHSDQPNAYYEMTRDHISVYALRDIKRGEQIFINYNGDPEDKTPIDFNEWL